ncbi:ABC transporter ATP-binding protein [Qipengyuania vesicularis]|uniref:ABC transporter ATP-binding protein n=1 Tax=Qipengyuania vesicularis TaxID=2867232 RepID=UPI001C8843FF|nr:ATP-binding cassette domain-containing protein [Qipengyuania vesicularis]MBX7526619.1 ATP-binding cassette domain-containing protein [Qipengyuania vesicularis]
MTLEARNLVLTERLAGISCSLQAGQITAICGPNGAGKSSLLQALAGLLEIDAGEVRLDGAALPSSPERARCVGYLPQSPEIAWDVSVRSIVELGRIPWRDAAVEPVEAALDALDLKGFEHRRAQTLSGGEQARVLLARVLAGEPGWILADEPLAALDLAHQAALVGHLRKAAQAGRGVVVVLHDLAVAMNHADRVLVLNEGRLAADGAPEEALSSALIGKVWGVETRWLGDAGRKALATS